MAPSDRPITVYVPQSGLDVSLRSLIIGETYTIPQITTENWFFKMCTGPPVECCYVHYHLTLDSGVLHAAASFSTHLPLACEGEAQITSNTLLLRHY